MEGASEREREGGRGREGNEVQEIPVLQAHDMTFSHYFPVSHPHRTEGYALLCSPHIDRSKYGKHMGCTFRRVRRWQLLQVSGVSRLSYKQQNRAQAHTPSPGFGALCTPITQGLMVATGANNEGNT